MRQRRRKNDLSVSAEEIYPTFEIAGVGGIALSRWLRSPCSIPPLLEIGAHPDFVLILIEHTTDWGHLVLRKAEDG